MFSSEDKVLLALSGGLDSVVMSYLFDRAGFDFGIAHCNFKLRGKAADEDEVFVRKLSEKMGKPFYSISFDTEKFAKERLHRRWVRLLISKQRRIGIQLEIPL